MLIVAYKMNERLVENVNNDDSACSSTILVMAFLIVTGGNIFWIVMQFQ